MTAAIFPTYLLARMVVSRFWALFAAIGAVAGPSLAYGSFVIEEPLAYPAAALSFLLIAKGLVTRSWRWNIAASIVGAPRHAVRGQLAVLIVAYVLAALFLAWTSDPMTRWRAGWSAWDWVGFVVLTIGGIIVFSASVGAFSQSWLVATGYYRHRMIVYGLWAGGAFSIGVGLLPVISLAALVRPKGEPWTRELRAFVALTSASVVVFGLYTAVKAAYLSTVFSTVVEERNLIYLAPLLLRRHGARAPAAAPEPRRAGRERRLRPLRHPDHPLPARPLPVRRRARARNRPDGEPRPRLRRRRREGPPRRSCSSSRIALLLLPGLRAVARRHWLGTGITVVAAVLVLAWNVAGEVSASNGVNNFSKNLLRQLPHPADLDRRRNRRQADDLPRARRSPTHRESG